MALVALRVFFIISIVFLVACFIVWLCVRKGGGRK